MKIKRKIKEKPKQETRKKRKRKKMDNFKRKIMRGQYGLRKAPTHD